MDSDELERGTGGLEIDWEGFGGERRGRMERVCEGCRMVVSDR